MSEPTDTNAVEGAGNVPATTAAEAEVVGVRTGMFGVHDGGDTSGYGGLVRTVSFAAPSAADPNRRLIVFAVNAHNRWSNAAVSEYDIPVDVNGDNTADYTVVGVDQGAVQTGSFNDRACAWSTSVRTACMATRFAS